MHPDLFHNALFLRYYHTWQRDPTSIVFAPLAEFLLRYRMVDDAYAMCQAGLRHHPHLVSGKLVMAKVFAARGEEEEATDLVRQVIADYPENTQARELLRTLEVPPAVAEPENVSRGWRTVTMARILSSQGHYTQAREIYEAILKSDPRNEAARNGLQLIADRSNEPW